MGIKIIFSRKAIHETFEVVDRYDKQSKGLGKRFFQVLQKG